jgi:serine protease
MSSVRPRRSVRLALHSLEARTVPASGLANGPSGSLADRVIVQMTGDQAPRSRLMAGAEDLGNGLFAVDLRANVSVGRALSTFRLQSRVAFAEPDYLVRAANTPNDANFGSLWGLNNIGQTGGASDADIDATEAWDMSTGAGSVAVGVIDSGVDYRHPDLYLNIWINQAEIPPTVRSALTDTDSDGRITFYDLNNLVNQGPGRVTDLNANGRIDAGDILPSTASGGWSDGVDEGFNGYRDDLIGWDFYNNDNNPLDDNGHGTHVAGTIGAIGNNGLGVAGVNWRAQIAALKFLGASGSGPTSAAVSALNYAVANGIPVTNNSWGGGGFSSALNSAITAAQNAGQIFVAAAGNNNSNNDSFASYPSNYPQPNVVAVGSSTAADGRSSFSNYGATTVDLFAPGSNILSTTPNGTYSTLSGTSMATPFVTGAIALVWDAHPTWTAQQVIAAIKNSVDVKPAFQGLSVTGGRLNVDRAVRYGSVVTDQAGPRVTSAVFSGTGNAIDQVRVTFSEPINAATFTAADVALTGPFGTIVPSGVTAVSATQFDVMFPSQTAVGTYTMTIGPDIRDAAGNPMNQDNDAFNGEPADVYTATRTLTNVQTFGSTDVNKTIVDNARTISTLTINQDLTIADLNLTVNLSHTWDSDLRVWLVAPDGTYIMLVNRRGGSGDNFSNTTFDDEAGVGIASGFAPFSGTYRPEQSLSTFDGKNARGTWQLVIDDLALYDSGRVNGWSMTVRS